MNYHMKLLYITSKFSKIHLSKLNDVMHSSKGIKKNLIQRLAWQPFTATFFY